jgi:putative RecB family exonuclease
MPLYSHSKLSTFEQCKLKFKYRYIDRITPKIKETIESHLGRVVHDTLEWVYKQAKKDKSPTIDEIITFYTKKWKKNYNSEIPIVKKELTVKDYFNKGVEFLVSYYNEHTPFKDGTIECEKKVWINLDAKGKYKILGFIDRLVYNFETEEYEIHDYKTANNLPSQERIDNDRQLALYSIAIKELFGHDKEVRLIWHYLAHNKRIDSKRTDEQLHQLKRETLDLIKEIEATEEFPHNKSVLCNWCEFKDICDAYKFE